MILALVKAVISTSATLTTLTTLTTQSGRDLDSDDFGSNRSSGQYNFLKPRATTPVLFLWPREKSFRRFGQLRGGGRCFSDARYRVAQFFGSGFQSLSSFGPPSFFFPAFWPRLFVCARVWNCCGALDQAQFFDPRQDRPAKFSETKSRFPRSLAHTHGIDPVFSRIRNVSNDLQAALIRNI